MTTKKIVRSLSCEEMKRTTGGKAQEVPGMKGFAKRIPRRNRKLEGRK